MGVCVPATIYVYMIIRARVIPAGRRGHAVFLGWIRRGWARDRYHRNSCKTEKQKKKNYKKIRIFFRRARRRLNAAYQ